MVDGELELLRRPSVMKWSQFCVCRLKDTPMTLPKSGGRRLEEEAEVNGGQRGLHKSASNYTQLISDLSYENSFVKHQNPLQAAKHCMWTGMAREHPGSMRRMHRRRREEEKRCRGAVKVSFVQQTVLVCRIRLVLPCEVTGCRIAFASALPSTFSSMVSLSETLSSALRSEHSETSPHWRGARRAK